MGTDHTLAAARNSPRLQHKKENTILVVLQVSLSGTKSSDVVPSCMTPRRHKGQGFYIYKGTETKDPIHFTHVRVCKDSEELHERDMELCRTLKWSEAAGTPRQMAG